MTLDSATVVEFVNMVTGILIFSMAIDGILVNFLNPLTLEDISLLSGAWYE